MSDILKYIPIKIVIQILGIMITVMGSVYFVYDAIGDSITAIEFRQTSLGWRLDKHESGDEKKHQEQKKIIKQFIDEYREDRIEDRRRFDALMGRMK